MSVSTGYSYGEVVSFRTNKFSEFRDVKIVRIDATRPNPFLLWDEDRGWQFWASKDQIV